MDNNKYNVLISYDVNEKQTPVKDGLIKMGYLDKFEFEGNAKIFNLPNTTLWKKNMDSSIALNDMNKVCRDLNVKLERFVVSKFECVNAIIGDPYKE